MDFRVDSRWAPQVRDLGDDPRHQVSDGSDSTHNVLLKPFLKLRSENLFKKFMRDTGVVVFLNYSYENTNIQTCDGKILGTNVSQGAVVSSGDTILLIVSSTTED